MGRPTGWWSGPPHICSAGAAAASAARIGCRSGSTAYTAAQAAATAAAASAVTAAAAPAARRRTGDRTALLRAGAGTGAGGIRGRSTADRAGRLSAAGIAAPLLNKVRERKAAEAAVAGRSHSVFLQKKIWEHPFPCHSMPHVPDACRKTEKPGRHTVVRVLDTKIERKLNAWRTAARGELPSSRTSFFPSFSGHGSGSQRLSAWHGIRG